MSENQPLNLPTLEALQQEIGRLQAYINQLEATPVAAIETSPIKQQKALFAVITKIRESLDLETIFASTATEVRQLLNADRVGMFRFTPNSDYQQGEFVSEAVLPGFPSALATPVEDHCFGRHYETYYREGRVWACSDISQSDLPQCYQAILARFHIRANLVVPLLKGEELWGLLCIHQCSGPRHWQESEIEFCLQIATHLGVALQQTNFVTQLQIHSQQLQDAVAQAVEREKAVAAIIDKIRRSLDLDTIFKTTVEEVRQLVKADRVVIYRFNRDWSGEFLVESVAALWESLLTQQDQTIELRRNISECSVKQLKTPPTVDTYLRDTNGGQFRYGEIYRVVNDIYTTNFDTCYLEVLERYQARAYATIAIYKGQNLWGLLAAFQNSGPRQWEQTEVNFLVQIGNQLGVAIQQAELLEQARTRSVELKTALTAQLRQRADELSQEAQRERAINEVIEKIRQTLNLNTIFQTAATEVRQLLNSDRVCVFVFDPTSDYCEGEFISEDVLPEYCSALAAKVQDFCFGYQYASQYQDGRIQAVTDIHQAGLSDCHVNILKRFQVRSNLVVPLLKGEMLWGLLCIHQCSRPREWQPIEIEFVTKIAVHLGVALQQAELLEDAQKQSQELQIALAQVQAQKEQLTRVAEQERALAQVIDKIRQTLDLETIFQTTATEVRQLLNADRVGMYRFEPQNGWSCGEFVSEDVLPPYASALAAKIEDHCFGQHHAQYYQEGRIWVADDIYDLKLSLCHVGILEQFQVKANLVVPLLEGEELWGLLCIHQCSGPRHWQNWEIEFVTKIAVHLGVALQQAELLVQAQRRSTELQIALAQVEQQKEQQAKAAQQERALARVIERIRQTLDIDTIFSTTTQEVRQILNCDRVVVYRFAPDWSGEFIFESVAEGWISLVTESKRTEWVDSHLQDTKGGRYRHHECCTVDNIYVVRLSECHLKMLEFCEAKAYCVVPVFVGDKLWGLLGAYQNSGPRHWEPGDVSLMAQVGNQLGVGLNQAQLLEQTKRQSKELRTTLADLNAIVDNLADGLLVTDTQGYITRFNPALLAMFSLEGVNLKGQHLSERFSEELVELVVKTERHELGMVTAEVDLVNDRAGQALATTIIKEAEGDEGDQCLGSVILIRDVTVEREVDRMKTEFLATVSHELRTPLTSVLGFASMIQEKLEDVVFPAIPDPNQKLQKAMKRVGGNIEIIVSEAERLTSLINDVLDIAKMEAGRVEWNMQWSDPTLILKRAMAATSSLFEQNQLRLIADLAPGLPQVFVDCDRMIQVTINLISNAVKFTPAGMVTCRARVEQDELVVSIIDTGIGIALEDQELVFERFKQVGDILTDKPKGTGLGLPICKQIIDYHGGRIWVDSTLGEGSTFSFTIPLNAKVPFSPEI